MLDDKLRSDLEQNTALVTELWPPLWKQLYDALLKQNFSEVQALELLKTYILSSGSAPIKP
jgi:hypothetical protein